MHAKAFFLVVFFWLGGWLGHSLVQVVHRSSDGSQEGNLTPHGDAVDENHGQDGETGSKRQSLKWR